MSNYPICVFCNKNDSPPSKEDVLPKWIAREIPSDLITVTQSDIEGKVGRQYKTRGHFGIVVNRQCRRCNNEWMSRLEHSVKPIMVPMMDGKSCALSQKQQSIIAKWLLKTTMTFELNRKEPPRHYFNSKDRKSLCESLAVPPHTVMYLARYFGKRGGHVSAFRANLTITTNHGYEVCNAYAMTLAVKQLALQIFTVRWPKKLNVREIQVPHTENWAGVTLDLWPIRNNFLRWPPPLVLDDKHMEVFINRWRSVRPT